jgi:hypothetical protein
LKMEFENNSKHPSSERNDSDSSSEDLEWLISAGVPMAYTEYKPRYKIGEEESLRSIKCENILGKMVKITDVEKAYDKITIPNLIEMYDDLLDTGHLSWEEYEDLMSVAVDWHNANLDLEGNTLCEKNTGIPQGSPLAPLIYALYSAWLQRKMDQDNIQHLTYADNHVISGETPLVEEYVQTLKENYKKGGLNFGSEVTIAPGSEGRLRVLGHWYIWNAGIQSLDLTNLLEGLKKQGEVPLFKFPPFLGAQMFKLHIASKVRFQASILFMAERQLEDWWTLIYKELATLWKRYYATVKNEMKYLAEHGITFVTLANKFMISGRDKFLADFANKYITSETPLTSNSRYKDFVSFTYAYWVRGLAPIHERLPDFKGWLIAVKKINFGVRSVFQWNRLVKQGIDIHRDYQVKLVKNFQYYRHDDPNCRDFIHNLRIMDSIYFELAYGEEGLTDLVMDDYYARLPLMEATDMLDGLKRDLKRKAVGMEIENAPADVELINSLENK